MSSITRQKRDLADIEIAKALICALRMSDPQAYISAYPEDGDFKGTIDGHFDLAVVAQNLRPKMMLILQAVESDRSASAATGGSDGLLNTAFTF